MRYEYISFIWFRKIDLFYFCYVKCKDKYLFKEVYFFGFCYCGFKMGEN